MWTQKEIEILKNNHNKLTLAQIVPLLDNKEYYATRSKAQRLGLFRDRSVTKLPIKYFHDTEFWSIPNELNNYMAGIVATDGCIYLSKNNTNIFAYKVAVKDEKLINLFIKELKFTGKKMYCQSKSPHSDNISKLVYINIGNFDKNAAYLKEHFNLIPNKTKRLGPTNLKDDKLNLFFLLGAVEGDGSVEYGEVNGYRSCNIGISSCSRVFLVWIKDLIDRVFPFTMYSSMREALISYHKEDHYYRFYVGGLRAAIIINYFRSIRTENIGILSRKWDNPDIINFIEEKKKLHPELFVIPNSLKNNFPFPLPECNVSMKAETEESGKSGQDFTSNFIDKLAENLVVA